MLSALVAALLVLAPLLDVQSTVGSGQFGDAAIDLVAMLQHTSNALGEVARAGNAALSLVADG